MDTEPLLCGDCGDDITEAPVRYRMPDGKTICRACFAYRKVAVHEIGQSLKFFANSPLTQLKSIVMKGATNGKQ